MQGDILRACPVLQFVEMDDGSGGPPKVAGRSETFDVMVLSQSCDLVESQGAPKISQVMLCAVFGYDAVKKAGEHPLNHKPTARQACAGAHPQYFGIAAFDDPAYPGLALPMSFVVFAQTFALPVNYVRRIASGSGERLRLNSTYREAVATRFGSFFGRIAVDAPAELPA